MKTAKRPANHNQAPTDLKLLERRVTFEEAIEIAKSVHGRLPTLLEFIGTLKGNLEIYNQKRYWLGHEPNIKLSTHYRLDYENGTMERVSKEEWDAIPAEQRIFAYRGKGPFSVFVAEKSDIRLEILPFMGREDDACVALVCYGDVLAKAEAALKRLKRGIEGSGA